MICLATRLDKSIKIAKMAIPWTLIHGADNSPAVSVSGSFISVTAGLCEFCSVLI